MSYVKNAYQIISRVKVEETNILLSLDVAEIC